MTLSERERRFVEAYMGEAAGNATRASEMAGYKPASARSQGSRLLTRRNIQAAIAEREQADPAVSTREERQRFWASTMRNADVPWKDRLKASELAGKAGADFVERHEHSGPNGEAIKTIVNNYVAPPPVAGGAPAR